MQKRKCVKVRLVFYVAWSKWTICDPAHCSHSSFRTEWLDVTSYKGTQQFREEVEIQRWYDMTTGHAPSSLQINKQFNYFMAKFSLSTKNGENRAL